MTVKIAAFDLGSSMAMATNALTWDGEPVTAFKKFTGDRAIRAADTLSWFIEVLPTVDAVIYERPFARGMDATRCLWGIAGIIEAVAGRQAAIHDPTPAEIKRWATGVGGGKKADMLEAARHLGYPGDNEHEADAWCLLRFAEAHLTIVGDPS